ncbi:response regulator [Chitinophaga lutea]
MSKVLILDDDQSILEVVSIVLSRRKFDVLAIHDPAQLKTSMDDFRPDLVLMDIALGKYDGRTLCLEIKHSGDGKQLPVVLFTAQQFTPESITACRADAIIEKPFHLDRLCNTINQFLHH